MKYKEVKVPFLKPPFCFLPHSYLMWEVGEKVGDEGESLESKGNEGKLGYVGCGICGEYILDPTELFRDFAIALHRVQFCFNVVLEFLV